MEDLNIYRVCSGVAGGLYSQMSQKQEIYDLLLPCCCTDSQKSYEEKFTTLWKEHAFNVEIMIVIRTKMRYMTVLESSFLNLYSFKTSILTTGV